MSDDKSSKRLKARVYAPLLRAEGDIRQALGSLPCQGMQECKCALTRAIAEVRKVRTLVAPPK